MSANKALSLQRFNAFIAQLVAVLPNDISCLSQVRFGRSVLTAITLWRLVLTLAGLLRLIRRAFPLLCLLLARRRSVLVGSPVDGFNL